MDILIRTTDPNTQVFVDGIQKVGPAAGTTPPPVTPPPTPTGIQLPGAPTAFEIGGMYIWPTRSQIKPTISCMGPTWKRMQLYVPQPGINGFLVKPNNLGKLNIAEPTGYNDFEREVLVYAEAVLVFMGPPTSAFGVNFTVGNPTGYRTLGAAFNLQPGQLVTVFSRSHTATPLDRTTFFFEWITPERY